MAKVRNYHKILPDCCVGQLQLQMVLYGMQIANW